MAIKRGIRTMLAEVGKIKTGYKGKEVTSKNNKKFRPPKKLDYFVVTTTERDGDGNFIPNGDVMSKLGDKPKEIKIRLPFDSVDKNFFTQFQMYNGGKKLCAGDGEKAERKGELAVDAKGYVQQKGEDVHTIQCDPETCKIFQAGKCKVSGVLSAFLPDSGDLGGVYKFRTHSWNAVSSITAALEYFKANTGGILQGLPLKLVMVKKTTAEHGTINYATVVIDGEEIRGLRRLAVEERESRKLLGTDVQDIEAKAEASGFFDDSDPEADVEAEYYVEDDEPTQSEEIKQELENAVVEEKETQETPVEAPQENDLF